MKLRIIWMLLLLIGIISNYSCKKTIDYAYEYSYKYKNTLDFDLLIKTMNFTDGDTLSCEYKIPSHDYLTQIDYIEASTNENLITFADSIIVLFDEKRISQFSKEDENKFNPLNGDNLEEETISKYQTLGTYSFTDADLENAIPIE